MRRGTLAFFAAAAIAAAAAAQPAGTITCQFNQRGHNCSASRCSVSTIASGGKFRFDLSAKTMCVPQGDNCVPVGTFGAFHHDAASGAMVIFVGDTRGAMTVRVDKDGLMVASTTSPANSVSVFGGKCEK